MKKNVLVKTSKIQGKGVYANKDFKRNDIVLIIDDTNVITDKNLITKQQFENACDYLDNGKIILMKEPEVYINHSCNPSTYVKTIDGVRKVFAMKDIKKGDEITYDYSINGDNDGTFICHCGSDKCRKIYDGNFFHLPIEKQKEYIPYLDVWFVAKYKKEIEKIKI